MMKNKILLATAIFFSFENLFAGELIIYTELNPPYVIKDLKSGKITGEAVKHVEEILTAAKIDFKIMAQPLKRSLSIVEKNADTCVFPVVRNQERETKFFWVTPIAVSSYGIYSLEQIKSKLQYIDDLKQFNSRIGAKLGTAVEEDLIRAGVKVLTFENYSQVQDLFQGKRISLLAVDTKVSEDLANKYNLKFFEVMLLGRSLKSLACNKKIGPDKIELLNEKLFESFRKK